MAVGGVRDMISKKGKRRMEYNGAVYYWFVRKNREGVPRIHILSEDKKVNLDSLCLTLRFPPPDRRSNGF